MAYGGTKPVPFQRAICESQALEPGITGNFTRHSTARVWLKTNCTDNPFDSEASAECLRSMSMETLIDLQLETHSNSPSQNDGDNWLPVVGEYEHLKSVSAPVFVLIGANPCPSDGDFVPDVPSVLMAEHRFANITTIIGWCDNDAVLFVPTDNNTPQDTEKWVRLYLPAFTEANLQKLLSLYPSSDFYTTYFANGKVKLHSEVYRVGRIFRDILFTCQPIYYGQVLAEAGNPVYFFDQNQTMLTPQLVKEGLPGEGVVHTSELLYVFGNLSKFDVPGYPYHPTALDFQLRDQESRSWSSFTAVGKPSLPRHDTLQGWKTAQFDDENYGTCE